MESQQPGGNSANPTTRMAAEVFDSVLRMACRSPLRSSGVPDPLIAVCMTWLLENDRAAYGDAVRLLRAESETRLAFDFARASGLDREAAMAVAFACVRDRNEGDELDPDQTCVIEHRYHRDGRVDLVNVRPLGESGGAR